MPLSSRNARNGVKPLTAELARLRAGGLLDKEIEALAASYVHMWLNRLCRSENTFQEYVTYALLAQGLRARAARQQAEN